MKNPPRHRWLMMIVAAVWPSAQTNAQGTLGNGTFQDLDFESGTIVPLRGRPTGVVHAAQRVPGWTVSIGAVAQMQIWYPATDIAHFDPSEFVLTEAPNVIDDNHGGLLLVGGLAHSPTVSVQQTGVIPVGANDVQVMTTILKTSETTFEKKDLKHFRFVPMLEDREWGK